MAQLSAGMPQLADGISALSTGTAGIATGASRLASGLDTLASGAAKLATGASTAADGAHTLADGTASATGGMSRLTDAATLSLDAGKLLAAQAGNLATNGTTLHDNATALAADLPRSSADIGSYGSETRTRLGAMAADPIAVSATRANAVNGPGAGLAPFLMALAAWLGVLGAFLVLPAIWASDSRRWVRGVLIGFGLAALAGAAGALLMVIGLRFLLGVAVVDIAALLVFAVLATLAFTAILQALVALFGTRGWLVGLLLLVVQVAAAGLPYAASSIPGPVAALHPFLPMTYTVDAMRGAIAGGGSSPAVDAFVLAAFLVVALLVTLAAAAGPALRREGSAGEVAATA